MTTETTQTASNPTTRPLRDGLEGVVVAATELSEVDGAAGRLVVRGRWIEQLTGVVSCEEIARLLWQGLAVPAPGSAAEVQAALGKARGEAFALLARNPSLGELAAGLPAVAALRFGLAGLDPRGGPAHYLAAGAIPVLVAAFDRARRGLPAVPPDPAAGQAADFLRMLRGEPARGEEAAGLDAYLVTVAEHGMNASTFTARVVASTRAGVLPAVIAALSALEGPLHGGAPGPVLDMIDALAGAADRGSWLAAELAAGRRLMGFGHRIYRVRDPRADVLKAEVAKLRGAGLGSRLAFAEQVEREALAALARHRPDRRLDTNVEFYTALLLDALAIDRRLFTSIFALGRVAGWIAHVFEQEKSGRLIRPQSQYVGPRP
jgi:citrate synthase